MGETPRGCGAGRIDLRVPQREAWMRHVSNSPHSSTTLAFLHFRGFPTLHVDMGGWTEKEGGEPSWELKASSKS